MENCWSQSTGSSRLDPIDWIALPFPPEVLAWGLDPIDWIALQFPPAVLTWGARFASGSSLRLRLGFSGWGHRWVASAARPSSRFAWGGGYGVTVFAQSDFKHFGSFIEKYVLDGELDKIYLQKEDAKNIIPFEKANN